MAEQQAHAVYLPQFFAQSREAQRRAAYIDAVAREVGAERFHDENIFKDQAQADAFAERMGPVND